MHTDYANQVMVRETGGVLEDLLLSLICCPALHTSDRV